MFRHLSLSALLLTICASSTAAPPSWWAIREATNGDPVKDTAPVIQGQLKHFTKKAVIEMNESLPGGAGAELNELIDDWITAHPHPDDNAVIATGQLKWVAKLIYNRLIEVHYQDDPPAWLPWTPDSSDKQVASIGQLKTVFNFDLTAPVNTLPEWWQKYYFNGAVGIDPLGDYDGDGLSNYQEYVQHSSPLTFVESDGDGMPDAWEVDNGLNPLVDDSLEDHDGDRIPNLFEYERWTRADDNTSLPAPTFIVDPATGASSSSDNTFTTITEAVSKAQETHLDSLTDTYVPVEPCPIIFVKAAVYPEDVGLHSPLILLLGELSAPQGPPVITGNGEYEYALLTMDHAAVVDGFVLSHKAGTKGSGVISKFYYEETFPRRRLVNCIIRGNESSEGGGIYNNGPNLDIVHCTIMRNKAGSKGGAIYNDEGKINLINSIVWDNNGGIMNEIDSKSSFTEPVTVTNSIISAGEKGGFNEDPKVTPAGFLMSTSPAINRTGSSLTYASLVDINGETRPVGSLPDIGADEYKDSNLTADGDGLPDWIEAMSDDADGLSLVNEYLTGSNPAFPDTDGDGLNDGAEITNNTSPTNADTDGDGMTDGWEVTNGLYPLFNDALADPDHDCYPNLHEFYQNKNPLNGSVKPVPDYIVDPSGISSPYTTISAAVAEIDWWEVRKIIAVLPGTYSPTSEGPYPAYTQIPEECLIVAPSGPGTTILDGENEGQSFSIGGILSGFKITGMNSSVGQLFHKRSGILGCNIESNISNSPLIYINNEGGSMVDTLFKSNQAASMVTCSNGLIQNCRFESNSALSRGCIEQSDEGTVKIYNSFFVNNIGASDGIVGCFKVASTTPTTLGYAASFLNCTFTGNNVAGTGTAGLFYLNANTRPVEVRNSIAWSNNSRPIFKNSQSNLIISHSDIEVAYAGTWIYNINPVLVTNQKISTTSPCLDLASGNYLAPWDYDYQPRVLGSYADLGPHEVGDGDADNDGLPDRWEIQNFTNITARNGSGDEDGDGITNLNEYLWGKTPATYNGVQNIEVLDKEINAASTSRSMRIRFTSYLNQTVTLKFYKFYYDLNKTAGSSYGGFGQSHFDLITTKTHSAVVGENIYTWDGIVSPPSGFHSADVVGVEVTSTRPSSSITEVVGSPSTYVDAQQITKGTTGEWYNESGSSVSQFRNVPTPVSYAISSRQPAILNTRTHHTLLQNRPSTAKGLTVWDWIPIKDDGSADKFNYAPETVTGRNLPILSSIYQNQYPEVTNFTVQSARSIPSNGEVGHIRFNLSKSTQVTFELAEPPPSFSRYPIYVRQPGGSYVQALNLSLAAGDHDLEFRVLNHATPSQPTHFNYAKVLGGTEPGLFRVRAGWVRDTRLQGSTPEALRGFKWAHIHVE